MTDDTHTADATEVIETLNEGDVIEVPQYKTPMEVSYIGHRDDGTVRMVGVEFVRNETQTMKSLHVSEGGTVYLMAGNTDKGSLSTITVHEDEEDESDEDERPPAEEQVEVAEGDRVRVDWTPAPNENALGTPSEEVFEATVNGVYWNAGDVLVSVERVEEGWPNGRTYDCAPSWVEPVEDAEEDAEDDEGEADASDDDEADACESGDEAAQTRLDRSGQTRLDEFHEVATDGGEAAEDEDDEDADPHFDAEAETVSEAWEGVFIYASWGYGQTNVNTAQIVDVSDTGKTVVARMVPTERVEAVKGSEQVRPTAEPYGEEFRLHVRNAAGDPVFRGSYPYIDGDSDTGTRKGSFFPWSKKAGATVHQTPTNHGH